MYVHQKPVQKNSNIQTSNAVTTQHDELCEKDNLQSANVSHKWPWNTCQSYKYIHLPFQNRYVRNVVAKAV